VRKGRLYGQHVRLPLAGMHLEQWLQQAGEEEGHAAAQKSMGWEITLSFTSNSHQLYITILKIKILSS